MDDDLDSDCFIIPFKDDNATSTNGLWTNKPQIDLSGGPKLRLEVHSIIWDRLKTQSQKIIQRLYSSLSTEIMNFITEEEDIPFHLPEAFGEVPTALVVGGTSSTNSFVLEDLDFRINRMTDVHRSHIHGKECSSLTVALRSLVQGFIGGVDVNEDEDDQVAANKQKLSGGPKLATHDLHLLESWYSALLDHNSGIPSKLVVLIHDVESINPSILEDLFYICGLHVDRLPLFFVICLSTSPNYLHSTISRSALTNLGITHFHAAATERQFDEVIQGLFFDISFQPDVMLGPNVLDMLSNSCDDRLATLDALMTSLQLLLLEHCSRPLSSLTTDEVEFPSDTENSEFFAHLRSKLEAESSSKGKEDNVDSEIRQSIADATSTGDDSSLLECVDDLRRQFHEQAALFRVAFDLLVKLRTSLKLTRARKDRSNDFIINACTVLDGKDTVNLINSTVDKIDKLSLTEIQALLQHLYQFFTQELPPDIRQLEMNTCSVLVLLINEIGSESEDPDEEDEPATKKNVKLDLARLEDVAALSKRNIIKSKHTDKVKNFLADYLSDGLRPCHSFPISEIWCLGARTARSVEHMRNPSIVSSITSALIRPQNYLRCSCCTSGTYTLPDESVAFLRYLDAGKMINVYDWFEAFTISMEGEERKVVESPAKKGKSKSKGKGKREGEGVEEDDEQLRKGLQARFLRCFHELDLLGFLKHTGRKQDHVMRTVFELND